MGEEQGVVSALPVTSPPAVEVRSEGPSELDQIRGRLRELQVALAERFSRKSWEEYLRLRRAVLSQRA